MQVHLGPPGNAVCSPADPHIQAHQPSVGRCRCAFGPTGSGHWMDDHPLVSRHLNPIPPIPPISPISPPHTHTQHTHNTHTHTHRDVINQCYLKIIAARKRQWREMHRAMGYCSKDTPGCYAVDRILTTKIFFRNKLSASRYVAYVKKYLEVRFLYFLKFIRPPGRPSRRSHPGTSAPCCPLPNPPSPLPPPPLPLPPPPPFPLPPLSYPRRRVISWTENVSSCWGGRCGGGPGRSSP